MAIEGVGASQAGRAQPVRETRNEESRRTTEEARTERRQSEEAANERRAAEEGGEVDLTA